MSPSALAKWSSTEASVLVNIEMFQDEVGEAGGVWAEEAAAAANPVSAFTRMIAGIVGVTLGAAVWFGVGVGVGVGIGVGVTTGPPVPL